MGTALFKSSVSVRLINQTLTFPTLSDFSVRHFCSEKSLGVPGKCSHPSLGERRRCLTVCTIYLNAKAPHPRKCEVLKATCRAPPHPFCASGLSQLVLQSKWTNASITSEKTGAKTREETLLQSAQNCFSLVV